MSTGAKNVTFLAYVKHWGKETKTKREGEKFVMKTNIRQINENNRVKEEGMGNNTDTGRIAIRSKEQEVNNRSK